jgi:hypothetical protein
MKKWIKKRLYNLRERLIGSRLQAVKDELRTELTELRTELTELRTDLQYHKDDNNCWDHFSLRHGYDNLISQLQLGLIEQVIPGNRVRLEGLRDTHKGERCFVIGNGPSLTATDLDLLRVNKEFCFASKGIFYIFDQTKWRPDVWGISDMAYLLPHEDEIRNLNGFIKFLSCQAIINHNIVMDDAVYYPFLNTERVPFFFFFYITRGIYFYTSITCKLIAIASYMGFTEIFLLGVDNSAKVVLGENGKSQIIVDHFSRDYNKNGGVSVAQYYDFYVKNASRIYPDIKAMCGLYGINIYNATRGGELEVFERIMLEDALKRSKN